MVPVPGPYFPSRMGSRKKNKKCNFRICLNEKLSFPCAAPVRNGLAKRFRERMDDRSRLCAKNGGIINRSSRRCEAKRTRATDLWKRACETDVYVCI